MKLQTMSDLHFERYVAGATRSRGVIGLLRHTPTRGDRMTASGTSTRRGLSLLQLAEELGNVSKACKLIGPPGPHPGRR
jgi:hypothetical protein